MKPGNWSHLPIQERLLYGKNEGEALVRKKLRKAGILISPTNSDYEDITLKTDGYLDGDRQEPVQIKLRRTSRGNRDDVALEVCKSYDNTVPLMEQLKNPRKRGKDFVGFEFVKHYFVLNKRQTRIYYIPAVYFKVLILQSINQLRRSYHRGILQNVFRASTGVQLRVTLDTDKYSKVSVSHPYKILAFIPVEVAAVRTYEDW